MTALLAQGVPAPARVVKLLRDASGGERDAMLHLLQRTLGNAYVQRVTKEMSSEGVVDEVDEGLILADGAAPSPLVLHRPPAVLDNADSPLGGLGVSVNYVANNLDHAMSVKRANTFNEVMGGSVEDLVTQSIAAAQGRPIRRLTITGHGRAGVQHLGVGASPKSPPTLSGEMSAKDRQVLARLRPYFAPGAEVILEGCQVGASDIGEALVLQLAELWNVRVRAGVSYQNMRNPGLEGTQVIGVPGAAHVAVRESSDNEYHRDVVGARLFPDADERTVRTLDRASDSQLASMPQHERYSSVVSLLGHTTAHEAELVVRVFKTASLQDRRELYRMIEGHPWSGLFRTDDGLVRYLGTARARELLDLLGG